MLRMNLSFPGSEKREKGTPHESLRSPRTYPIVSSKPEIGGAAPGPVNRNFCIYEQSKQYFANNEQKTLNSSPKDNGKATNGSKNDPASSQMNKGRMPGKQLENARSGRFPSGDATAFSSSPGHSTIIKETKLLSSSDSVFSVSCDPNMFTLPSRSTTCHYCGLHGSLRCGQCKQAYYCSEACQKKDWSTHISVCKPLMQNKLEGAPKSPGESRDQANPQKSVAEQIPISPSSAPKTEPKISKRIMLSDLQSINLKKGTNIQGTILGFKSPTEFFVQIYSTEVAEYMNNITITLKSAYSNITAKELYNPVKGEVCVAKYSVDQNWCRVAVQDVDLMREKAQLLFIDFGNEEEASLDNIYSLHSNVGLYPPAAIKCSVANVIPVQGEWTQECISSVGQLLLGQYCSFTVVDMQQEATLHCSMEVTIASSGKSLEEVLLETGHACRQSEHQKKDATTPAALSVTTVNREKPDEDNALKNDVPIHKLISLAVGDVFSAAVTDIQTPEDFFCQQLQDARQLSELQAALAAHYGRTPPCENFSPVVGDVCCARFTEDNQWYRATVIQAKSQDSALVGYVDYGNFEVLPISRLRPILPRFMELRWQAIRCMLAGVKPPLGNWTSDAISVMKEKVANKMMTVKVVKKIEKTSVVELVDEAADPVVNIANYLLEARYAVHADGEYKTAIPNEVDRKPCQFAIKEVTWANLTIGQKTDVTVCVLNSPDEFYCQIYNEDVYALIELNKVLAEYCQTMQNNTSKLLKGDFCCAFFSDDGNWYRGLVKDISEDGSAKVHFVDYGNIENVSTDKLRVIPPTFLKLPFQGIQCWLSGVKSVNEHWTPEATKKLRMCVCGRKLLAIPICITEDGVGVELVDNTQEHPLSISELLIQEHLALKKNTNTDGLPGREPTGAFGMSPKNEVNSKLDMQTLYNRGNNLDLLSNVNADTLQERVQGSHFDKLPSIEQVSKLDIQAKNETDGNVDSPSKRVSSDKYEMPGKRGTGGRFDIPLSREPGIQTEAPTREKGSTSERPSARQMCEIIDPGTICSVLSGNEGTNDCGMSPNGKQYNMLDKGGSTVDVLPDKGTPSCTYVEPKKEPSDRGISLRWKSVELPIEGATQVCVLKVESPNLFYVRLKENQVDKEKLQWTMIELAEYCSSQKNQNYMPRVGEACCARYTGDNHWYRAVVLDTLGSTVKVAYVDYGNVEYLQTSRIFPIQPSFLELPFQLVRCSLAGVMPKTDEWSASAVDYFKALVVDQDLTATVLGVNDDIYTLTITKKKSDGLISVADELVLEGLAIRHNFNICQSQATGIPCSCYCKELLKQVGTLQQEVATLERRNTQLFQLLEKMNISKKLTFEE
ncbi:tudor domain-containing protein 1 [Ambystoma mexicanum]|uniref:tudor domain-containing protein 1 n=1 Tax=Ambystoma mexicanum TaxID=8296 RepID=UPI0037E90230